MSKFQKIVNYNLVGTIWIFHGHSYLNETSNLYMQFFSPQIACVIFKDYVQMNLCKVP
jgi:hypothetical protein